MRMEENIDERVKTAIVSRGSAAENVLNYPDGIHIPGGAQETGSSLFYYDTWQRPGMTGEQVIAEFIDMLGHEVNPQSLNEKPYLRPYEMKARGIERLVEGHLAVYNLAYCKKGSEEGWEQVCKDALAVVAAGMLHLARLPDAPNDWWYDSDLQDISQKVGQFLERQPLQDMFLFSRCGIVAAREKLDAKRLALQIRGEEWQLKELHLRLKRPEEERCPACDKREMAFHEERLAQLRAAVAKRGRGGR